MTDKRVEIDYMKKLADCEAKYGRIWPILPDGRYDPDRQIDVWQSDQPEPGDCDEEWNVKFTNFQRADAHPFFDLDGKVIVGSLYTVDFECPGCGYEHKTISFIGWTAIKCQGCSATLNREEPAYSSWSVQMLRDMNSFWSLVLSWLAVNRPSLRISGRTAAMKYCHKFDCTLEEFVLFNELKEEDIARYLNSKLP